jgi:hypothetical protein
MTAEGIKRISYHTSPMVYEWLRNRSLIDRVSITEVITRCISHCATCDGFVPPRPVDKPRLPMQSIEELNALDSEVYKHSEGKSLEEQLNSMGLSETEKQEIRDQIAKEGKR